MADRLMGKEAAADEAEKARPKAKKAPSTASGEETASGASARAAGDPSKDPAARAPDAGDHDADDSTDLKGAIAELLKKGDLGALADKVGVDRKAVDASSAKLRLGRKREQEADRKLAAAEAKAREVAEIHESARREYGAPHKAREAYDRGDFHEAAQWISHSLGDDFATITRNVANATKGMSPEALKQFQRERELKQREAALEAKERRHTESITQQQADERALKAVNAKCAGHDVLKIKGGDRLVKKLLEDKFDPQTGTIGIGYRQAADMVVAEFLENAKALGLVKADEVEPPPPAQVIVHTPPPAPAPPPKPRGKREFPADKGLDSEGDKRKGQGFERRRALADRLFERGRP